MWRAIVGLTLATATAASTAALAAVPAYAAGQTFTVTSSAMCGGAGTFEQAIKDANASPGRDTIVFTPGMSVSAAPCATHAGPDLFPVNATEAVDIVGNGAKIFGDMHWVDFQGRVNNFLLCPRTTAGSQWLEKSTGFLSVGTYGQDNSAVDVNVTGLSFDNMPALVLAFQKSSFTMNDSSAQNINSFNDDCSQGAIGGFPGANLALHNVRIMDSYAPSRDTGANARGGLISGENGALVLDRVFLGNNWQGRAVSWRASSGNSSAKVVSSKIIESGGLRLDATTSQVVNSAFLSQGQKPTDRIVTNSGTTSITASSFYWTQPTCDAADCAVNGMGFWAPTSGAFSFASTAVGANAIYPNSGPLLFGDTSKFSSDAATWVQQTANQSNAALHTMLPNVLTTFPGLTPTGAGIGWADYLTPLLGTQLKPGVLIDAVPDAVCPGGANALRSPLDNSCITEDVLGKPRWDAGNGTRNIGAVQTVGAPHLTLASVDTTSVSLAWNRPKDPPSGVITGYNVYYSPAGGGAQQVFYVPGGDTLTATIPGLTSGTPYVFTVAGVNQVGPGPRSNEVVATPVGAIPAPVVTALPGTHEVRLSWTEPPLNGHAGPPSYFVQYRKVGDQNWTAGPGNLSGRTALIPELVNGTAYEFGVVATTADQAASPLGTTTATPTAGVGASVFVPIEPARVYDSRLAGPGGTPLPIPGNHGSRVMQVADAIDIATGHVVQRNIVPAGATAVAFNLTATNTQARGWFSITPGNAATFNNSTVNWPGGSDVIAAGLTVQIAPDRTVKVFNGSTMPTDAVLDTSGYFIDPAQAGNVFHDITPTRVYDSRIAGPGGTANPIAGKSNRVISVANGIDPVTPDVVPAGATAIAYNISAVDTAGRGWFAVTSGDASAYRASTVNWAGPGDVIDNGQFGVIDAARQIKVFSGANTPTNVVIEVLGYYTPSTDAIDGSYLHGIDPVRAYDSRVPQPQPGPVDGGATRNVSVADGRNLTTGAVTVPDAIPADASSIIYTITATNTTNRGWFSVTPGNVGPHTTSSINWPTANNVVANGLSVGVDDARTINVRSGSPSQTDLVVDLYGYFR